MKIHPKEVTLAELLHRLPSSARATLHHLLLCSECRSSSRSSLPGNTKDSGTEPSTEHSGSSENVLPWRVPAHHYLNQSEALEETLRRTLDRLRQDKDRAPELVAELSCLPAAERSEALEQSRFHTLAVAEQLLQVSRNRLYDSPREGEELARLALEVVQRMPRGEYRPGLRRDFIGRAWTEIANALRAASDFAAAERAFQTAWGALQASQDPLERAHFFHRLASLRRDQKRFRESLKGYDRACSIYLRLEQNQAAGRVLNDKGNTLLEMGEPERAVPELQRALELIDAELEPRTYLSVQHNLAWAWTDQEKYEEAARSFDEIQPLYDQVTDASAQQRRRWLEGRIQAGLGHPKEAETAFREVRRGFIEREIAYDAALVSLDLAWVLGAQGRCGEVQALATEMITIFSSRKIHREAIAALTFLHQAAQREQVTQDTIRRLSTFLTRHRANPELRFQQPQ